LPVCTYDSNVRRAGESLGDTVYERCDDEGIGVELQDEINLHVAGNPLEPGQHTDAKSSADPVARPVTRIAEDDRTIRQPCFG
jgi:hypothetical protein